ncbi:MAG: 50S ribosomal protein L6 [Thermaerobacter sp.]|nr:50S ribosomal protein L6 [Thermaerobacter sp.]
MSRIGKRPIPVPTGVKVELEGSAVRVTGPKGVLSRLLSPEIQVTLQGAEVVVTRPSDAPKHRALHGLTRTLVANMVEGVSNGFEKRLELVGVGYRASKQGDKLVLTVGYSHPVEIVPPEGIAIQVPANNAVVVQGADRERVGELAAQIRRVRPPEPYQGKGIRYQGEVVRRKVGKTGKK